MSPPAWIIVLGAVGMAVGAALMWWDRRRQASGPGPTQVVRVRVKGRYRPERIVVGAGRPVRLVFHREETAACSERVVFPDLGRSASLPAYRDVPVELPPSEPGEHEFTCQLGMLHGRLLVVPDEHGRPGRTSGGGT